MRKKYFIILLYFISCFVYAQRVSEDLVPQRIILNLTPEPATSIAVTWRTNIEVNEPKVQVAISTQWIEFKNYIINSSAMKERFITEHKEEVFHYSAVIKNLLPNTKYVYRVGSDSVWSEWNQFTTADDKNSEFKFVYLGDPQNNIMEYCSRVFREAFKTASDADFWLFGGDLVTDPLDDLWSEFFYAAGFVFRVTPIIAAPGNHDHKLITVDGKLRRSREIGNTWKVHFTLPENGPDGLKETSYYLDYQGTRFVIINSQANVEEQTLWLENILAENSNKWTVVCFHHPIYSSGRERDDQKTRNAFQPLFDKYSVDLVLTGHDHSYARSKKIFNGKAVDNNVNGTVYVVSVSGPKAYPLGNKYNNLMVKTGENVQLFQVIVVKENKISFNAYTVNGLLYDSFEIIK
ncbi:MAG: metallophosphoesterase family protein [Melioribacteraceae bacterium]|nr:metallophosphoesterase family protein [Melioribacteraceae bacterium]